MTVEGDNLILIRWWSIWSKGESLVGDDVDIFQVGLNRCDGDSKVVWVLACGDEGVCFSEKVANVWCEKARAGELLKIFLNNHHDGWINLSELEASDEFGVSRGDLAEG